MEICTLLPVSRTTTSGVRGSRISQALRIITEKVHLEVLGANYVDYVSSVADGIESTTLPIGGILGCIKDHCGEPECGLAMSLSLPAFVVVPKCRTLRVVEESHS